MKSKQIVTIDHQVIKHKERNEEVVGIVNLNIK